MRAVLFSKPSRELPAAGGLTSASSPVMYLFWRGPTTSQEPRAVRSSAVDFDWICQTARESEAPAGKYFLGARQPARGASEKGRDRETHKEERRSGSEL